MELFAQLLDLAGMSSTMIGHVCHGMLNQKICHVCHGMLNRVLLAVKSYLHFTVNFCCCLHDLFDVCAFECAAVSLRNCHRLQGAS